MRKLLALTLMLMLLMAPVATVVYAEDDPVEEEGGTEGGDETPDGDEGDEGTGDDDAGDDDEEDDETDDETDDDEDTDDDDEELTEDEDDGDEETDDDGDDDETDDDEEDEETEDIDDDDDETDDEDEDEEDDEDKPLDPVLLDELLNQAYDAQLGVNTTMSALMSQFGPVSQAGQQSYLHGGEAIDLALRFMNENQTHAAANQIQRALKHYKNALHMLYDEDPEALEELEEEYEEELEDVEEPPEPEGNETSAIKGAKLKLMEQFEGNLQERIRLMRQTMENATDQLSEQDAQKIRGALERADAKLERMQQRLNNSEVDEAIDEAEDAEDEIEEGLEGLEDKAAGQMLKTIYRLEAKLQKMENIRNRKSEKGLNVSDDDEDIDEAKGKLKEHKENWKGGKFGPTDAGNGDGSSGETGGNPDAGKPDVTPGNGGN